jgi:DNA-binding CsgD family transcriptional regulator
MDGGRDSGGLRLDGDQALGLVTHDRWVLGGIRDGRLRVFADSRPEPERLFSRVRPLSNLARRCLHDRRPLSVTAVPHLNGESTGPPGEPNENQKAPDWEVAWPALLYAPVGLPGRQPVGLLILGTQTEHWYSQDEIDYVAAVGVGLTAAVLARDGRWAHLRVGERAAARLLASGLSVCELAAALQVEEQQARSLMATVLRKLSLRSPRQVADEWPEIRHLSI